MQIKLGPADPIFGPVKESDKASTKKPIGFFGRLWRFGTRAVVIVGLCGVAWVAGAYYSSAHPNFDLMKWARGLSGLQQSPEHDEMVATVRQMAEDIRTLKSSLASQTANLPSQTSQPASVQTATSPTLTNLVGRVDKLEVEVTTKLSQINEQLATIQQQVATPRAALPSRTEAHAAVASHVEARRKRVEHLHDAFDPSQAPMAPGAPRPLGSH